MNLQTRRILYIITIIVFVLAAPVLFMYGIGYRYDTATSTLIQTAGIFVRTYPSAEVTINNTTVITDSPARARYLDPGLAIVDLAAQGRLPVRFTADLRQSEVAVIDPIELFSENPSRTQTIKNITSYSLSPFSHVILAFHETDESSDMLVLGTSQQLERFSLFQSSGHAITSVHWTPNTALISTDSGVFVFYISSSNLYGPLSGIESLTVANDTEDKLFVVANGSLYTIDVNTNTTILNPLNANSYYLHGDSHVYTVGSNGSTRLVVANEKNRTDIGVLPGIPTYTPLNEKLLMVSVNKKLYLLDTSLLQLTELSGNVTDWILAKDRLFYASGNEIWSMSLQDGEKQFINRFSAAPSDIAVSPRLSAMFLTFENSTIIWYLTTPSPSFVEISTKSQTTYKSIQSDLYYGITLHQDLLTVDEYTL